MTCIFCKNEFANPQLRLCAAVRTEACVNEFKCNPAQPDHQEVLTCPICGRCLQGSPHWNANWEEVEQALYHALYRPYFGLDLRARVRHTGANQRR